MIIVDKKTRLVVQGITGGEGTFHTKQMIEYGTNVVAGVTPGKGGTAYKGNEKDAFTREIPVYNCALPLLRRLEPARNYAVITL